jgi:4-alpha-glucanotransferase
MNEPLKRSSGVLLHPTSLPGPNGIGDIGPAAFTWIDALARAKQSWWQILPLGPTGYGDSPYQCFSAFAGNIYLLSPELLKRDGLLCDADLGGQSFRDDCVDYGRVIPFKQGLLRRAWQSFRSGRAAGMREPFEQFQAEQRSWLDDFSLFIAIKEARRGASWTSWPPELTRAGGKTLDAARRELTDDVGLHQFGQFLFFRQWRALRDHAHARGVSIIGDAPIFVSADSADVWANPKLFLLDAAMRPKVVAGVPPDYFSRTGQLWGNPLYDWRAMRAEGYRWWCDRLRATLAQVDLVRLDHFRGFAAAWHIPAGEPTAVKGSWVPGPAADLFDALKADFGDLPLIAEDLGEITPDVYALRDRYGLPGMKVLQFAFDGPGNPFLPHSYRSPNCVVYTGTHDNDTSLGWYSHLTENDRHFVRKYLSCEDCDVVAELLRIAWASTAQLAVAPLQDVLELGSEARMNLPGRPDGNWQWRMREGAFDDLAIGRLGEMTETYGRAPAR